MGSARAGSNPADVGLAMIARVKACCASPLNYPHPLPPPTQPPHTRRDRPHELLTLMLPRGLEPRTLRLFGVRSDQLSYESHDNAQSHGVICANMLATNKRDTTHTQVLAILIRHIAYRDAARHSDATPFIRWPNSPNAPLGVWVRWVWGRGGLVGRASLIARPTF